MILLYKRNTHNNTKSLFQKNTNSFSTFINYLAKVQLNNIKKLNYINNLVYKNLVQIIKQIKDWQLIKSISKRLRTIN